MNPRLIDSAKSFPRHCFTQ